MEFIDAKFITSAADKKSWPQTDLKEVVLAGRSNVGKSSLINTLCNRKNLAYVGKTPGKTTLLNFFNIANQFVLVDVPGYGYATRSQKQLVDFGNMMEEYFTQRSNLTVCVIIVDSRHVPTQDDLSMIEFVRHHQIPLILVATKIDKLSNNQLNKNLSIISNKCNVEIKDIIPFSSLSKKGLDRLRDAIDNYIK